MGMDRIANPMVTAKHVLTYLQVCLITTTLLFNVLFSSPQHFYSSVTSCLILMHTQETFLMISSYLFLP